VRAAPFVFLSVNAAISKTFLSSPGSWSCSRQMSVVRISGPKLPMRPPAARPAPADVKPVGVGLSPAAIPPPFYQWSPKSPRPKALECCEAETHLLPGELRASARSLPKRTPRSANSCPSALLR